MRTIAARSRPVPVAAPRRAPYPEAAAARKADIVLSAEHPTARVANHVRLPGSVPSGFFNECASASNRARTRWIRQMPDFRFVIGAILAVAMLGLAGLGLLASCGWLRRHATARCRSRSLAFAERVDWRQIGDNDVARRLDALRIDPNAGVADAPAPTPAVLAVAAPAERAPAMPPPEAAAEPLPPATPARMTDRAAPAPEPGVETNLPELVSADASAAGTVAPEPAPERKTEMTAVALADEPDPVSPPAQSTDASLRYPSRSQAPLRPHRRRAGRTNHPSRRSRTLRRCRCRRCRQGDRSCLRPQSRVGR